MCIYTYLYIHYLASSPKNISHSFFFQRDGVKPIKHERNVHNIKRHRSINPKSRVKGSAIVDRSTGGGRGKGRGGSSFAKSGSERCVPVRGSTWIRGTWDPTVAILPHLVTIQSTMLPSLPLPFSIALVLHQFLLYPLPSCSSPYLSEFHPSFSFSSFSFNEKERKRFSRTIILFF